MKKEDIIMFIKKEIAEAVNQDPDFIDDDAVFLKIGLSSIQALKIINKLRKKYRADISPVALFEYKTISAFAAYLKEFEKEVI